MAGAGTHRTCSAAGETRGVISTVMINRCGRNPARLHCQNLETPQVPRNDETAVPVRPTTYVPYGLRSLPFNLKNRAIDRHSLGASIHR